MQQQSQMGRLWQLDGRCVRSLLEAQLVEAPQLDWLSSRPVHLPSLHERSLLSTMTPVFEILVFQPTYLALVRQH